MGEGLNLNQNTFIIAACLRPASVVCVRADGQTGTNSLVALPKSREREMLIMAALHLIPTATATDRN